MGKSGRLMCQYDICTMLSMCTMFTVCKQNIQHSILLTKRWEHLFEFTSGAGWHMIKHIDFQPSNSSSASDPVYDLKFLKCFLPQFPPQYMGIIIIEYTTRGYEDRLNLNA